MKTKRILALVLAIVTVLLSFASCGKVAEEGNVTVVIEGRDGEFTVYKTYLENVENKAEGAVGVLENLRDRETNPLSVNIGSGSYGAFLNSIGSLEPNPENEYIAIYTNEENDFAVPSEYMPTVSTASYDGMTLTYSGVGLGSMTVQDGTVLLFRIEGF